MEIKLKSAGMVNKSFTHEVNCFCITENYFHDIELRNTTADHLLDFINTNFEQIQDPIGKDLIGMIWSRTSNDIAAGKIQIKEIAKRLAGYPHGLVLEHSFVLINEENVFQKPNPKVISKTEIVNLQKALEEYKIKPGYEVTWHKLLTNFKLSLREVSELK